MTEVDNINIPAYQRKRSLSAKARKKPLYTQTRKRPTKRVNQIKFEDPIIEMPIVSHMPSETLFTEEEVEVNITSPQISGTREMQTCGICEGYFASIEVAIIKTTSPIREGDIILFEKEGGLFEQVVSSMQIDRKPVKLARSGSDIGLKTSMKPKVGAPVYKVI